MPNIWDYLPEFTAALEAQLQDDAKRWGDTWLRRTRDGQELRTWENYRNKFDKYFNAGVPVPWLQITGDALICWIREQHPELWNK